MTQSPDYARGVAAERDRIGAILALPEAKRHPSMAIDLALKHGASVADARIALGGFGSHGGGGGLSHGWDEVVGRLNTSAEGGLGANHGWDSAVAQIEKGR